MSAFAVLYFDAGEIRLFDVSGYGKVDIAWFCGACGADRQGFSSRKLALQSAHDHADEHDEEP